MSDDAKEKKERKPERKTPSKPARVNLIRQDNSGALVQWHDGQNLRRAIIKPSDLGRDGNEHVCSQEALENARDYGDDFSAIVDLSACNPGELRRQLNARGIWTYEDAMQNTIEVNSAFRALVAEAYSGFVRVIVDRKRG